MASGQKSLIHGLSETEVRIFVGKGADYYLKKWTTAKDPNLRAGWNWFALLAGLFWLGYRKMYSCLFLFIGIVLLADIIGVTTSAVEFSGFVSFILSILLGMFGNTIYFGHVNKKISSIKKEYRDIETQKTEMAKAGGTSWTGVILTFFTLLIYGFISVELNAVLKELLNR